MTKQPNKPRLAISYLCPNHGQLNLTQAEIADGKCTNCGAFLSIGDINLVNNPTTDSQDELANDKDNGLDYDAHKDGYLLGRNPHADIRYHDELRAKVSSIIRSPMKSEVSTADIAVGMLSSTHLAEIVGNIVNHIHANYCPKSQAVLKSELLANREKYKSICGCPMCDFHTSAYKPNGTKGDTHE